LIGEQERSGVKRLASVALKRESAALAFDHIQNGLGALPIGVLRLTNVERHPPLNETPAQSWLALFQKVIDMALENTRSNVSVAASQLGINRQTLHRKLHERAARS
jgi:DNA-binding NtrC family response regulator